MAWTWATSEREPADAPRFEVVEVHNALVTPLTRGPLRTEQGPFRWTRGAVHDAEGVLVPESQRAWMGDRNAPVAADPERVRTPRGTRRLKGTWIYTGHWSDHFGHFLLETLTNLWPDPSTYDAPLAGVIAHRPVRGPLPADHDRLPVQAPELTAWQRQLLELAGYGTGQVRTVHGRPVRVQRLLVPARPVLLKRWALPPAVEVWRRVSEAVGRRGAHARVYLSRSRLPADPRRGARTHEAWTAHLDAEFAHAGFLVVHPETLSIGEQIELVRGAEVLAGLSGSALHLSAFAERGTRVLVLGDDRSRRKPAPSQQIVDAACGHRTAFIANQDQAQLGALLGGLDQG